MSNDPQPDCDIVKQQRGKTEVNKLSYKEPYIFSYYILINILLFHVPVFPVLVGVIF